MPFTHHDGLKLLRMPKPNLDPATSSLTSGNLISGLPQTIHPGLKQRLIVAGPGSTRWGAHR